MVMALYALSLARGHTIYGKQIKLSCIKKYLQAAASFLQQFDPVHNRDPRNENHTKICQEIKAIYHQIDKYEKMPDRREAYTLAMHKQFYEDIQTNSRDDLQTCLYQWFTVTLQGGNRGGEWCQKRTHHNINRVDKNPVGDTRPFTLADVTFMLAGRRVIQLADALNTPDMVEHVRVCYRWQKNFDHNQKITYTRNRARPECDSVTCFLAICERFTRLFPGITDKPLAIYTTNKGVYHITDDLVASQMRELAKRVYNINEEEDLRRWSTHSLRVGACCILWAKGHSAAFIQQKLRWKSETWMLYTRDLDIHARQHNDTIDDLWKNEPMPTF